MTLRMRTIQHWIAGSETTGASTRFGPVYNPATGEQQAQVALATPADVDAAVAVAAKAFDAWRDVSLIRRARVMFALRDLIERHLDELSGIIADEHGKVLFGDTHVHGPEGVRFYTRAKAITSRWPGPEHDRTHMHFPTAT